LDRNGLQPFKAASMNRNSNQAAALPFGRVMSGLRWRGGGVRKRIRGGHGDGLSDHIRCRLELGFVLPPLDTMQNYPRLKFLHDCIRQFAPPTGVALEIGCFKCSSTVFIANACEKVRIQKVYAMDLFT